MKTLRKIIPVIIYVSISSLYTTLDAQTAYNSNEYTDVLSEQGIILKDFTATKYNDTAYIKWFIAGETSESLFIVERLDETGNCTVVGFKKGYSVPKAGIYLMYSVKDYVENSTNVFYRIRQIKEDNILYSNTIALFDRTPANQEFVKVFND